MGQGQRLALPVPHIQPRASKGTGEVSSAANSHVTALPQGLCGNGGGVDKGTYSLTSLC